MEKSQPHFLIQAAHLTPLPTGLPTGLQTVSTGLLTVGRVNEAALVDAVLFVPQVIFPEPLQHLVILIRTGRFGRSEGHLLALAAPPERVDVIYAVGFVHMRSLDAVKLAGEPGVLDGVIDDCGRGLRIWLRSASNAERVDIEGLFSPE